MKRALAVCAIAAALLKAATTQVWEMNGYLDFARGRFSGVSITYSGRLSLARTLTTVFDTSQAEVWSIATAPDGSVYLGTGNRGRLYRVDQAGQSSLEWTSDQPEIFAVTVDSKGVVYAGSSPDGRVYRIENGKATEYFAPGEHYIWALAVAPDGALLVGTGDHGKIYRVTAAGQGSVYYETGQAHVTSLAFYSGGRLLAGSEPNGILYRVTGQGKAFALYKSSLPEIHSIVPSPDGSVYVVAMGGGVAKKAGAAAGAITTTTSGAGAGAVVSTTVTVTEQENGINPAPKPEATPKPVVVTAAPAVVAAASSSGADTSTDKSALYKISADNSVETLWTSKEENIYDVALERSGSGSAVVFLTDAQGKLYRWEGTNRATLLAQTNEGDSTRLLATNRGLLIATGNLGKLLRLEPGAASSGWYESPVKDAGAVATWGRITWHGDGRGIVLRTRSGNSARPDETWSDWSQPVTGPAQAAIASPRARYIQWRAELSGSGVQPGMDDVTIAYLPQNSAPVVKALLVTGVSGSGSKSPVSDAQTIGHNAGEQIQVVWQADDPDGDKLVYSVYFRGEDEKQWKLLRANMTDSTYSMDGEALADGRYLFRVVASDAPSNPPETAKEGELTSTAVLVDNTPPSITLSGAARTAGGFQVYADAVDQASALRRCEYSVDGGAWTPVQAEQGITDAPRERFVIRIANLAPGEHLITVRVYDGAGNAGVAKVVAE